MAKRKRKTEKTRTLQRDVKTDGERKRERTGRRPDGEDEGEAGRSSGEEKKFESWRGGREKSKRTVK